MEEQSSRESLGKGIVFQYAYYASLTLSGAAFYLYLTHVFTTSVVGSIALLIAIVGLFPAFFTLGLQYGWQHFVSYAIGEGNSREIQRLKGQALWTGLLLALAAVIFLVVTARYISILFFHTEAYTSLILLLALDIPSAILISIMNGLLMGLQRFRSSGIIGMVYVIIVYASAVILLETFHSINAIPIGWGIGYMVGVVMYYLELSRGSAERVQGRWEYGSIFRYSLPLYATGILSFGATYIDRLTVAFLKDLSSIGIYTLVLLIVSGIGLLSTPIGGVVFSKFSEFYAKNDKEMIRECVRVSVNAASMLYVPAALGVSAISIPVLTLLGGGPNYISGGVPLAIILVANALFVANSPLAGALQGTRKTHIFVLSASMSMISNLLLSILLIPRLDLTGAAIGFSSVSGVGLVIVYYFARKAGVVKIDVGMLGKIWLSSIVMSVLVYLFAFATGFLEVLIPLYVITGIVAYIAMLRVTSAVSLADKQLLESLIPRNLSPLKLVVELL